MRKLGCFIFIILISILLGTLYSMFFQNNTSINDGNTNEDNESSPGISEEIEDGVEVSMKGDAVLEDGSLNLDVKTNLIKGTTVSIDLIAFDEDKSRIIDPIFLHLKDETSFTESIEIPEDHEGGFEVALNFSPNDYPIESEFAETYGDKGQKLTGPNVHMIEYFSQEDIYKKAKTSFYVLPDEDGKFETSFGEMEEKTPSDLGDFNIRLEAEAKADEDYIYIDGDTNILGGAIVSILPLNKDEHLFYIGQYATVNPDGSFHLIMDYDEDYAQYKEKFIELSFEPTELSPSWIIEHYGIEGENMKGDLVKDNRASLIIPIEE